MSATSSGQSASDLSQLVGRAEPSSAVIPGPVQDRPDAPAIEPPFPELLRERLQICLESIPIAKVAEGVGMSIESVRRYMRDGKPSSEFVFAVVTKLGVSGHWLFTGRGPWRKADRVSYDAASASPARLVGELTRRMARESCKPEWSPVVSADQGHARPGTAGQTQA